MRRRNELMDKLRVKILQDRRDGLTSEQIQARRGASSRTIANLVKGKDPRRFCIRCGETDPQKLEQHHPDRVNRPNETVTLCANCHSTVTRELQRKTNREKKKEICTPNTSPIHVSIPSRSMAQPQVAHTQCRPSTPAEKRCIGRGFSYGGGGIAVGEAHDVPFSIHRRMVDSGRNMNQNVGPTSRSTRPLSRSTI